MKTGSVLIIDDNHDVLLSLRLLLKHHYASVHTEHNPTRVAALLTQKPYDVVGFTKLSQRIAPQQLVALLDEVFSAFDAIAEQLHLEKIKTIGDAYMVVGGVPEPLDASVQRMADMALAMQSAIDRINDIRNTELAIRIGIHSGEVVAGVIGKKKFAYDLWGDTVNTASRMESHGEAGKIHVSEAVYEELKYSYMCESRGEIDVKGKGMMKTWFVLQKK